MIRHMSEVSACVCIWVDVVTPRVGAVAVFEMTDLALASVPFLSPLWAPNDAAGGGGRGEHDEAPGVRAQDADGAGRRAGVGAQGRGLGRDGGRAVRCAVLGAAAAASGSGGGGGGGGAQGLGLPTVG